MLYSNVFGQPCGGRRFSAASKFGVSTAPHGSAAGGGREVKLGRFNVMVSRLRTEIGGSSAAVHVSTPSYILRIGVSSVSAFGEMGARAPVSMRCRTAAAVNCLVSEPM